MSMCDTPRTLLSAHVKIRVWTGGCHEGFRDGWRLEGETRGLGDGYPEGGVGVQGRGRIRGGARWGEERGGTGWEGEMADHARSIYQNTPATRAHIHTCTRARARARVHVHPRDSVNICPPRMQIVNII